MTVLPTFLALLFAVQDGPPLKLELDHTIDARTGVSLSLVTWFDIGRDGAVVAVDEVNGRIYRFLPGGKLRDSLSRHGQGPGEFLAAAGLALGPAGELALADIRTRRITFWAPDGRLLRSTQLTGGLPVNLLWRGADPVIGSQVYGDSVVVGYAPIRFGSGESAGPWIGQFVDAMGSGRSTAVSCASCRQALTAEGKLLVAAPDTFYRVSEMDALGKVVRRWSRADIGAGLRTTDEVAELQRKLAKGPGGGMGSANPERSARPPASDALRYRPRFQGIGMDAGGRLLVLASNAGSDRPVLDVFRSAGPFLGSIVPAERLRAMVVRGSRMAALGESADGEPVIYVYRIEEVP